MNTFWTVWVIALVLVALVTMYYVIVRLYRKRQSANYDNVVAEYDGIEDRDGPVPKIFWLAYAVGLGMTLVYFLYMPALGSFQGLGGFQSPASSQALPLDELLAELNPDGKPELTNLAANPAVAAAGQRVFQGHCVACHRQNAQGQRQFPNLADADWLYGSSDAQIWHSISQGRRAAMPGWADVLSSEKIEHIVGYVVSLNEDRLPVSSPVDISDGRALFTEHCASCHGAKGGGNQELGVPNLTDDIWLYGGDKAQIADAITNGLNGAMPAFEGLLGRSELLAVAAYVKQLDLKALTRTQDQAAIARGLYLVRLGDCVSCHTAAEGGEPMAGGLAFALPPMGTFHTTNISQQVNPGLGDYSYEEFSEAMKKGKGKHGYLYPAMPYTSFMYVTDEDIKAIWAYLQSVNPRDRKNVSNTGLFSFNVRFPLGIWSLLFRGDDTLVHDDNKSSQWNRGKYLVLGLGHCGECHTPRNLVQAMVWERAFQGNLIDGWQAPDISATMLYRQGWTAPELANFLKHGYSNKGTVFGGMAEVISNSTRYLTDEDALAIATYLLEGDESIGNTIDPGAKLIVAPGLSNDAYADKVYKAFANNCGACHGAKGEGRDGIAPALKGNSVFSLDDYYNSVAVVLRGLDPAYSGLKDGAMPMVSYEDMMTDAHIAGLVTFVRRHFGGQSAAITAEDVERIRKALDKGGFTPKFHKVTKTAERPESM